MLKKLDLVKEPYGQNGGFVLKLENLPLRASVFMPFGEYGGCSIEVYYRWDDAPVKTDKELKYRRASRDTVDDVNHLLGWMLKDYLAEALRLQREDHRRVTRQIKSMAWAIEDVLDVSRWGPGWRRFARFV